MPKAGDAVIRQPPCDVECENLYLPSDFRSSERDLLEVAALGVIEIKLGEGEAFDSLLLLQTAVKTIVALWDQKNRNAHGQGENTRSATLIRNAEAHRDLHMQTYSFARSSMIRLGFIDAGNPHSPFPPLTLEDTFMKSVQRKRRLGDSRRGDGLLWQMSGSTSGSEVPPFGSRTEDITLTHASLWSPWSLHGVGTECTRSPHGVHTECTRSAHGVGKEWAWSGHGLHGVYMECTGSGHGAYKDSP